MELVKKRISNHDIAAKRRKNHKNQNSGLVKNPSPEGPVLISPQRDGVYFETSNGMMEWWNNGILGVKNRSATGGLISDL